MPHQYAGPTLKEFEKGEKIDRKKQLPCGALKKDMPKCYGQGCYHKETCDAVKKG